MSVDTGFCVVVSDDKFEDGAEILLCLALLSCCSCIRRPSSFSPPVVLVTFGRNDAGQWQSFCKTSQHPLLNCARKQRRGWRVQRGGIPQNAALQGVPAAAQCYRRNHAIKPLYNSEPSASLNLVIPDLLRRPCDKDNSNQNWVMWSSCEALGHVGEMARA